MHVNLRRRLLDGSTDGDIGLAIVVGMDASLQAHLRAAPLPGFTRASRYLRAIQIVGRPAQVAGIPSLGECAEATVKITDISVIDVAVNHVGDAVTVDLPAKLVGVAADV